MLKPTRKPSIFETTTCGRCGGCGHYSYNQMTGTTCFQCSGAGRVKTARGRRQYKAFMDALERPVSELQVGDWYWTGQSWRQVVELVETRMKWGTSVNGGPTEWHDEPAREIVIRISKDGRTRPALLGRYTDRVQSYRDKAQFEAIREAALAVK